MEAGRIAINMLWVREQVDASRQRLARDPDDLDARLQLAWGLFLEAMYEASPPAREEGSAEQPRQYVFSPQDGPGAALPEPDDSHAGVLMSEALQHAVVAKLLSVVPHHRSEAERLEQLIRSVTQGNGIEHIKAHIYRTITELSTEMFGTAVVNVTPEGAERPPVSGLGKTRSKRLRN